MRVFFRRCQTMSKKEARDMARKDAAASYCLISGTALIVVGAAGFFLPDLSGTVEFDRAHNLFHLIAGALAVYAALSEKEKLATWFAQGSGAAYVLLAIAGYVSPTLWWVGEATGLHLELAEDIFHLLVGGWGLYAGFERWLSPGLRGMCRA
jgi:hypothetical protein